MYVVKTRPWHSTMIAEGSAAKLRLWHERYSHKNLSDLRKLKTNNMVTGLDIPLKLIDILCEIATERKYTHCHIKF